MVSCSRFWFTKHAYPPRIFVTHRTHYYYTNRNIGHFVACPRSMLSFSLLVTLMHGHTYIGLFHYFTVLPLPLCQGRGAPVRPLNCICEPGLSSYIQTCRHELKPLILRFPERWRVSISRYESINGVSSCSLHCYQTPCHASIMKHASATTSMWPHSPLFPKPWSALNAAWEPLPTCEPNLQRSFEFESVHIMLRPKARHTHASLWQSATGVTRLLSGQLHRKASKLRYMVSLCF